MKLADEKALQELALKQQEQEKAKKESFVTEDELDELYHLATQEIDNLKLATSSFKKILKDSFYGDFMFEETLTNIFFETMDNLLIKLLPVILEGNYDIIYDELGGQISKESFNNLRIDIYDTLKEKYIKED